MVTEILYKRDNGSVPIVVGHFRESPLQVFEKLYTSHRIYKYKGILAPTDSRLEMRCSGLIISESDQPKNIHWPSVDDTWFSESLETENREEKDYFIALNDAVENYLTLFDNVSVDYFELRDWQKNEAKEAALRDILEIFSVITASPNPTAEDFVSELNFILNN